MKQHKNNKRKALKNKMAKALNEDLKVLPVKMRDILVDDLITAFETRISVLNQTQSAVHCFANLKEEVLNETIQA